MDTHCHIFGPVSKYPYVAERPYTPPEAPLDMFRALHAKIGVERAVIVNATTHGKDHRVVVDAIAASGSKREVYFFFGVRNVREHIHKAELEKLAAENDNIHLHIAYSKPSEKDVKGKDYQHEGRVGIELLKEILPSNNFEYFLCGSGAFMKSLTDGLEAWGVPDKDVHFEAFGPATVKKKTVVPSPSETVHLAKINVTFARSNKTVRWEPSLENLLEFAKAQGVKIDSGCCAGSCGSCGVAIKSGDVDYLKKPDATPETGSCFTCVCRPKNDLVLDA